MHQDIARGHSKRSSLAKAASRMRVAVLLLVLVAAALVSASARPEEGAVDLRAADAPLSPFAEEGHALTTEVPLHLLTLTAHTLTTTTEYLLLYPPLLVSTECGSCILGLSEGVDQLVFQLKQSQAKARAATRGGCQGLWAWSGAEAGARAAGRRARTTALGRPLHSAFGHRFRPLHVPPLALLCGTETKEVTHVAARGFEDKRLVPQGERPGPILQEGLSGRRTGCRKDDGGPSSFRAEPVQLERRRTAASSRGTAHTRTRILQTQRAMASKLVGVPSKFIAISRS
ncbi:Protein of unknown function [Gryllus bimaculatus]|nr:Protein of unknown function [Gryllus bimaculatus]